MKWYDIRDDRRRWRAFNIVIASRGVGKTYSALDYAINDAPGKFIYMRNKKEEILACATEFGNPFKAWNENNGRNIYMKNARECAYVMEDDPEGNPAVLGYGVALSTFSNLRGVDLSDVTDIIFDEAISKERLYYDQFNAFVNMYETINRNRELMERDPLRVFIFSNAQKLYSPILAGLGLIPIIENMTRTGQKNYSTREIWISLPESEVSEAKKDTVLYRAARKSRYYSEAIENKFSNDSFYGIRNKIRIVEYTPIAKLDDMYLWRHKSDGSLYVCSIPAINIPEYDSKVNTIILMRSLYVELATSYATGRLFFSDFQIKSKLLDIIR